MGFAVFVMSLRKKYVRRVRKNHPDFPNLNIMVRNEDNFNEAIDKQNGEQAEALNLNKPKRFNRIVKEEGWEIFNEIDGAYEFAYEKLKKLRAEHRRAKVYMDQPKTKHRVYCIQLTPDVWSDHKFKNKNDHLDLPEKDLSKIGAFYTGQTSLSSRERYDRHIDPDHKHRTKWGLDYFVREFEEAYEADLLNRFSEETSQRVEGLLHGESIIVEHQLAQWLRDKGYGAYCA